MNRPPVTWMARLTRPMDQFGEGRHFMTGVFIGTAIVVVVFLFA